MKNKFLVLVIILGVFLTTQGNAQRSAQAVMNVSVTIVKASEAEVPPVAQFQLSDSREVKKVSDLDSFVMSNMNITDGYLEFPDKVVLCNDKGEEIQLAVKASKESLKEKSFYSIRATPFSKEASLSGNYRGNYKVSMVYP